MIRERDYIEITDVRLYDFIYADSLLGRFSLVKESNGVSIWGVEINHNYRGIGLGIQMMKECIEFVKENFPKDSLVFLFVDSKNIAAVKTYEKVGFCFSQGKFQDDSRTKKMEMRL